VANSDVDLVAVADDSDPEAAQHRVVVEDLHPLGVLDDAVHAVLRQNGVLLKVIVVEESSHQRTAAGRTHPQKLLRQYSVHLLDWHTLVRDDAAVLDRVVVPLLVWLVVRIDGWPLRVLHLHFQDPREVVVDAHLLAVVVEPGRMGIGAGRGGYTTKRVKVPPRLLDREVADAADAEVAEEGVRELDPDV
jgi:hypothetical protein